MNLLIKSFKFIQLLKFILTLNFHFSMMKTHFVSTLGERLEEMLRQACGRLTPGRRLTTVLAASFLFAAGSLWMTASALYHTGRESAWRQFSQIEHMRQIELPHPVPDTLKYNPLNHLSDE